MLPSYSILQLMKASEKAGKSGLGLKSLVLCFTPILGVLAIALVAMIILA